MPGGILAGGIADTGSLYITNGGKTFRGGAGADFWMYDPGMRRRGLILNAEGLDFQASKMLWKGVFHSSALNGFFSAPMRLQ